MKKHLYILLPLVSLFVTTAKATHVVGGEITYEYVQDSVYNVSLELYRDCSGIALDTNPMDIGIICQSSGHYAELGLKYHSITDITYQCDSIKKPCDPKNTRIAGSKGLERHVFKSTLDFRTVAYKSIYSCGNIIFQVSLCCRSSDITTGQENSRFYISSELDLSKSTTNSSPKFVHAPVGKLCCNLMANLDFSAKDKDGDSLSYHLIDARISYSGKATYITGLNGNKPFNHFSTLNFDNEIGLLSFVPSKCNQVGVTVVAVKEWRKDKSGKYVQIGEISREVTSSTLSCNSNNLPTFSNRKSYSVCYGNELEFTIKSYDQSIGTPDSVRLAWNEGIVNASFKIVDDTALNQSALFKWRPDSNDISTSPHGFVVSALDDHCPTPGSAYAKYKVYVKPKLISRSNVLSLDCGYYQVDEYFDSTFLVKHTVHWQVLDTLGVEISDSTFVQFNSTNEATGTSKRDTIQFFKPGKYILKGTVSGTDMTCSVYTLDTIQTVGSLNLITPQDSILCRNVPFRIDLDSVHKARIQTFNWTLGQVYDSLHYFSGSLKDGPRFLFITAQDKSGCFMNDSILLSPLDAPKLSAISDTLICTKNELEFKALNVLDSGLVETKFRWNTGSEMDSIAVNSSGIYSILAENFCGIDTDTFEVTYDSNYIFDLGFDKFLCDMDSFLIGDQSGRNRINYIWSTGDTNAVIYAKKSTKYYLTYYNGCDTNKDSISIYFDQTPKPLQWKDTITYCDEVNDIYNAGDIGRYYLWNSNDTGQTSHITTPGWHWAEAQSRHCGSFRDSTYANLVYSPVVNLGSDRIVTKPFSVDLKAKIQEAQYLWNTGETTSMIRVSDYGQYWVTVTNSCGQVADTVNFTHDLGIFNTKESHLIQIVPNPNNGVWRVSYPNWDIEKITLFDQLGREVQFETLDDGRLKISHTNQGLFYLLIDTNQGVFFQKVLIEG